MTDRPIVAMPPFIPYPLELDTAIRAVAIGGYQKMVQVDDPKYGKAITYVNTPAGDVLDKYMKGSPMARWFRMNATEFPPPGFPRLNNLREKILGALGFRSGITPKVITGIDDFRGRVPPDIEIKIDNTRRNYIVTWMTDNDPVIRKEVAHESLYAIIETIEEFINDPNAKYEDPEQEALIRTAVRFYTLAPSFMPKVLTAIMEAGEDPIAGVFAEEMVDALRWAGRSKRIRDRWIP